MVEVIGRARKLRIALVAVTACFAMAEAAHAAPPSLVSVEHQERHPAASFAAPGADDATIYFATAPARATDGRFLEENVVHLDLLSSEEIQSGRWLDSERLDPGTYYVLLRAADFDCLDDPNCVSGFSNMLSLTIPKPVSRFRGTAKVYEFLSTVELTLRAAPLGEQLRYRVCWARARLSRRCVSSSLSGYSWDEPATDSVEVRKRGMRQRTTFSWYVGGRKVASKRVRVPGVR